MKIEVEVTILSSCEKYSTAIYPVQLIYSSTLQSFQIFEDSRKMEEILSYSPRNKSVWLFCRVILQRLHYSIHIFQHCNNNRACSCTDFNANKNHKHNRLDHNERSLKRNSHSGPWKRREPVDTAPGLHKLAEPALQRAQGRESRD